MRHNTENKIIVHSQKGCEETFHMWNLFEEIQPILSFKNTSTDTHWGERFTCETCLKIFSQSNNLKAHLLTHTGKKSFSCETCFKKFSLAGHLKTHLLTHTGKKSFSCETCFKKFSHDSTLKTHLLTHPGTKSFLCEICFRNSA